jgi:hypothetical protein
VVVVVGVRDAQLTVTVLVSALTPHDEEKGDSVLVPSDKAEGLLISSTELALSRPMALRVPSSRGVSRLVVVVERLEVVVGFRRAS